MSVWDVFNHNAKVQAPGSHSGAGVGPNTMSGAAQFPPNQPIGRNPMDLPSFCFDENTLGARNKLTPTGMLFLRLAWNNSDQHGGQMFNRYLVGKFAIPGVAIIDCVPLARSGKMKVMCWVEATDNTLEIEDNIDLFPSDSLLVKLRTLQKD